MDPRPYLAAGMTEAMIIAAVATEAQKLRDKRRTEEIKGIGVAVGNAVARLFK